MYDRSFKIGLLMSSFSKFLRRSALRYFLITLISISSFLCSKEHSLYVCAVFHNEARFLDEWVQFYLQQGVDKIYLYNNKSEDKYRKVLIKYILSSQVVLKPWPYANSNVSEWNHTQITAYNDFILNVKDLCDWCLLIDIDEFVFSPTGLLLPEILKRYSDCDQVGANWVFYGTSGIQKLEEGQYLTDNMVYRAVNVDQHIKCFVRPEKVQRCDSPHCCTMFPGSRTVNENKEKIEGLFTNTSAKILRVNHYWTRDMDFFLNEKAGRQQKWWGHTLLRLLETEKEMNEVYDPILVGSITH